MSRDAKQWLVEIALGAGYLGGLWWAITPPALPAVLVFAFVAVVGPALGYYLFGDVPRAPGGR